MIQANELRIGSLVEKDGNWFVADFITIRMAKNYNPIPLTPEILEKAGFVSKPQSDTVFSMFEHPEGMYLEIDWRRREAGYTPLDTDLEKFITIGVPIKYLHQLQNLFFALTGEELNIQP